MHRLLKRLFLTSVAALSLSGCAVPQFNVAHNESGPTTHTIVQRITCELMGLLDPSDDTGLRQLMLSGNYVAAMKVDLQVMHTGQLAPSFSFPKVGPLFSIAGGLKLNNQSYRSWFKYLSFSMLELEGRRTSSSDPKFGECPTGVNYNLEGDLGIKDFVLLDITSRRTASSGSIAKKQFSPGQSEFGGSVKFTLTKAINATGPTWKFEEFVGPGGLVTADRTSINTLTIVFVQGELPIEEDLKVANGLLRNELLQRDK